MVQPRQENLWDYINGLIGHADIDATVKIGDTTLKFNRKANASPPMSPAPVPNGDIICLNCQEHWPKTYNWCPKCGGSLSGGSCRSG